eukprot:3022428-Rhodomonas_salina.1
MAEEPPKGDVKMELDSEPSVAAAPAVEVPTKSEEPAPEPERQGPLALVTALPEIAQMPATSFAPLTPPERTTSDADDTFACPAKFSAGTP